MIKISKRIIALGLMVVILLGSTLNVKAAYVSDECVSKKFYSAVGLEVVKVTLHASGYVNQNPSYVTNKYITVDKCYVTNDVTNETVWIEETPDGEKAWGSFKLKIGIPTPWGVVGTSGTTHVLSIGFSSKCGVRIHSGSSRSF